MAAKTRSPIKDKPLRWPGQSLMEERRKLFEDKVETWLLLALMFAIVAAIEWWRYYRPLPPLPWLWTLAALVPGLVGGWRLYRLMPVLRRLRLGMEGEQVVGQFLERLREQGFQVFHDVPGEGFNVDHVCIGPAGVFTIETKTRSKPLGRDARINFDGERITVDGLEPERDTIRQAQSQSHWIAALLESSSGRKVFAQPVVVFPGWYVDAAPGAHRQVWVMEPKGLPAFLSREPLRLPPEDVKLLSYHLSRYIRVSQKPT